MKLATTLLAFGLLAFGQAKRTPGGKPDFSGVWSLAGGFNYAPADHELSFQPGGQARWNTQHGASDDPVGIHCLPAGMPRQAFAPFPLQIVQTPAQFIVLYEYAHFFRIIATDGRAHPKDVDTSWMGHSTGRWDGDAFVVDTVGLRDDTWMDGAGHMHSDALHVTERYSLAEDNTITWNVTIDDPKIFTKPWSVTRRLLRKSNWEIGEYVCEENNREGKKGKYE